MLCPNRYCCRDMSYSATIAIGWCISQPPQPIIDESIDVIDPNQYNNRSDQHVIHCIPMDISPVVNDMGFILHVPMIIICIYDVFVFKYR